MIRKEGLFQVSANQLSTVHVQSSVLSSCHTPEIYFALLVERRLLKALSSIVIR